ncbi:hypothetical protein [Nonomuraea sp. SBT364]|uniref:hypothetical protein n=1 Tax=Nonomuraea sp. SBT364 TaxID=1580530 RepID=UPI0007C78760|nr:hypothetical protein [Nonomuraea sp. SBT364]
MMRVLVPSRLRARARAWFDARYLPIADHRRDLKDALRQVQDLRDELTTLKGELNALRGQVRRLTDAPPPAPDADTRRLAQETAQALDGLLQNEVLLWQAVDELRSGRPAAGRPADAGAARERATEVRPCV